jgi:hypothetical protein
MINWSYVRRGRAAAWTELLCSAAQLTAHAPTPFSGQARFSFLVSRKMFGIPSVRDTTRSILLERRFESAILFWGMEGKSSNE